MFVRHAHFDWSVFSFKSLSPVSIHSMPWVVVWIKFRPLLYPVALDDLWWGLIYMTSKPALNINGLSHWSHWCMLIESLFSQEICFPKLYLLFHRHCLHVRDVSIETGVISHVCSRVVPVLTCCSVARQYVLFYISVYIVAVTGSKRIHVPCLIPIRANFIVLLFRWNWGGTVTENSWITGAK